MFDLIIPYAILSCCWLIALFLILRLFLIAGNLHLNSNKILLLILGVISFSIVRHLSIFIIRYVYDVYFPIGLIFNTSLACIIPILCYLYVKKSINTNEDFEYSDILHFLVFLVFYILFELPYKQNNIENIDLNSENLYWAIYFKAKTIPDWLIVLRNLLNITYSIMSYRLIIKTFKLKSSSKNESFLKKLLNTFTHVKSSSRQVEKVRRWLYNFTNIKFSLTLITLYFSILKIMRDQNIDDSQLTASSLVSILFLMLAIYLNKNRSILYSLPSFMKSDSLKREKIKEEIKEEEIYEYMLNQIEVEELYLNEKFRINWLSEKLGIKVEHINVTLIENNFKNFSMFSNYLKINKAKQLLKEGYLKDYNIEGLAYASGFKATNTFYRIFKKETGLTPKMYADNNNQIKQRKNII